VETVPQQILSLFIVNGSDKVQFGLANLKIQLLELNESQCLEETSSQLYSPFSEQVEYGQIPQEL
jgi:hypothetical protein